MPDGCPYSSSKKKKQVLHSLRRRGRKTGTERKAEEERRKKSRWLCRWGRLLMAEHRKISNETKVLFGLRLAGKRREYEDARKRL
jgi:hypothetical protein